MRGTKVSFNVNEMTLAELDELLSSTDMEGQLLTADRQQAYDAAVADTFVNLSSVAKKGQADALWGQLLAKPLVANVKLHVTIRSDLTLMESIVFLHTWQRWFAASNFVRAQSFYAAFKSTFSMSMSMGHLAQVTAEMTMDPKTNISLLNNAPVKPVEHALALFEMWLAMQAPLFYTHDAWVMRLTGTIVPWLPTTKGRRFLAPNTLLAILKTPLGNEIRCGLAELMPNHQWTDTLASLSSQEQVYLHNHVVTVGKDGVIPVMKLVQPDYGDVPRRY
jgi:hypothetical protein